MLDSIENVYEGGYHFITMSESWRAMCLGMPCSPLRFAARRRHQPTSPRDFDMECSVGARRCSWRAHDESIRVTD
jgi:hypothetical protein